MAQRAGSFTAGPRVPTYRLLNGEVWLQDADTNEANNSFDPTSFFNRFYKDDRTQAEWRWLFADWADCFTEPLHVVAEDGGRVVGMQAAMTMPFAHDGDVLPNRLGHAVESG